MCVYNINSKLDINFKTVTTNENFHSVSENNAVQQPQMPPRQQWQPLRVNTPHTHQHHLRTHSTNIYINQHTYMYVCVLQAPGLSLASLTVQRLATLRTEWHSRNRTLYTLDMEISD